MGATTKAVNSTAKSFLTISFSGAGHLLPYHLGVSAVLLEHGEKTLSSASSRDNKFLPPIRAVAGSSSGAIAATVLALLPHRLQDYTDRFLTDRGHAFRILNAMLAEEENQLQKTTSETSIPQSFPEDLVVCTTKCSDASIRLFNFSTHELLNSQGSDGRHRTRGDLLRAIEASCRIPSSFHPFDLFSKGSLQYYDGIEIDGELFADGGISAPAPPFATPANHIIDNTEAGKQEIRLVVSPISGTSVQQEKNVLFYEIRPRDTSWAIPYHLTCRCGSFRILMSAQNLLALVASAGAVSPQDLQSWYQRGIEDTNIFMDNYLSLHT